MCEVLVYRNEHESNERVHEQQHEEHAADPRRRANKFKLVRAVAWHSALRNNMEARMTGKSYYITTLGEWQRHSVRFANSHFIALDPRTPGAGVPDSVAPARCRRYERPRLGNGCQIATA
jgi:hypothetical protein